MKIFSIVVTYNGVRWIEKCLGSLKSSSVENQIMVIDNGSSDATLEAIREHSPDISLFQLKSNLGFGQANNIGIRLALERGADFVFLLNQDAWVYPNTLQILLQVSLDNPGFGIISPIHLNGKGDMLDGGFLYSLEPRRHPELFFDAFTKKKLKDIYEIPAANAAAWFLPKKTFDIVGGFDPIFFHYGEDNNYVQRVKYHQLKIGLAPNAFIHHDRDFFSDGAVRNHPKKQLIARFTDVSRNVPEEFAKELEVKNKWFWLNILRLNFKKAKNLNTEIRQLNAVKNDVLESWYKNRIPGMHYLTEEKTPSSLEVTIHPPRN